jgi:diguanylate cyclase (GGDEF)-like protein
MTQSFPGSTQMRFITRYVYSPHVPWRLLGALLLYALAYIFYYVTQIVPAGEPGYHGHAAYRMGLTIGVINALSAAGLGLLCLQGQRLRICLHQRSGQPFSPLLLAACLFCYALGQMIWLCHMLQIGHVPAYPSLEHLAGFAIYLPFSGAILLLPAGNLACWSRLRIFVDALMITAVVVTLFFSFLPSSLPLKGAGSSAATGVSGALLAADLLLGVSLLLLALRPEEAALRPVFAMLFVAILAMFTVHLAHTYEVLSPGFNEFSRASIGFMLAGILVVGAAQATGTLLATPSIREQLPPERDISENRPVVIQRTLSILPPILVVILSLLIFLIWRDDQIFAGRVRAVSMGGCALLVLMVVRQMLARLRRQLQSHNCTLHILNLQMEQQACADPLPGLPDHHALVEKLDMALRVARSEQAACAVIFMGIDHFKTINDRYGQTMGDRLLCLLAALVWEILPAGACVSRRGGEEFVALLPRSDSLQALDIAEQIRARMACTHQIGEHDLQVTCSLGVASYPQDASTREALLANADQAMDAARCLGRNQVCRAHETLVQATLAASTEAEAVEREEILTMVDALLMLLEVRDPMLSLHARRVSALSLKLALLLGLGNSQTYLVSLAGLLHDTGKVALPDHVLWQRDWPDDQEVHDMLLHPLIGARILAPLPTLQAVTAIVRTHHEHLDGSGYPDGLHGEQIPLGARIVSVADAYDTLTTCCLQRPACSPAQALSELQREAGQQFDRQVVQALTWLLAPDARWSASEVA